MWRKTRKAFTLIELMVVISIIVILVAMLYPSVISTIAAAREKQVAVRMNDLVTGCTQYYNVNNYYPGQSQSNLLELSHGTTGSQLLAEALFLDFSDPAWDNGAGATNLTAAGASTANRSQWHWKSVYASLNYGVVSTSPPGQTTDRSDLMCPANYTTSAVRGKPYCIADRFPTNFLPILYFPAHQVDANGNPLTGLSQFVEGDNIAYYNFAGSQVFYVAGNPAPNNVGWMAPNGVNSQSLTTASGFICDLRYGNTNTPYNPGGYLLIAAGRDRIYGSPYTIKNW